MGYNQKAFFALVRAGLWEQNVRLVSFGKIDYFEVLRLAEEQSVVGLVTAGLERVVDINVPKEEVFQFISQTLQIEQRNLSMNEFVARLIELLHKEDINAVLVKGQGIAQCYEKPLWRASGDIDLLLSSENYEKAKSLLLPLAIDVETEYSYMKHQGMTILEAFGTSDQGRVNGWLVELHGTLHSRLSKRVDRVIDEAQEDVCGGNVRSWMNGNTILSLPSPDNDAVFIFTHIIHHFFFEGIGMRQICDWCRLLWTYRASLNHGLLESRIKAMGIMTEWKAFAAYAVEYLGMPVESMPLYSSDDCWKRKSRKINAFILDVGNFGHKQRRNYNGMSYVVRKFISFWGRLSDMLRHFMIFPKDSIVFFGGVLWSGLYAAVRGE